MDLGDYYTNNTYEPYHVRQTYPLPAGDDEYAGATGLVRTRDVMGLRVNELLDLERRRAHTKRQPIMINGEAVKENLRQRLTREKAELEIALTQIAGQLTRRTEQVEHLNRYPNVDPCEDGAIITFEKKFPHGDTLYSYVAHKADGRWYVTGERSPQGVSWDDLVDFMGLGVEKVYQIGGRGGRRKIIG